MNKLNGPHVVVVMSLSEGRGFDFLKKPMIVEAILNKNIIDSDQIPPDSNPQIHTELVWETLKKEARNLRTSHAAIRINCYTIDANEQREKIGFILPHLRSAKPILNHEVHEVEYKWYKLIGVPSPYKQFKPELCFSLSIRDKIFHEGQINQEPLTSCIEEVIPEENIFSNLSKYSEKVAVPIYLDEGWIQLGDKSTDIKRFLLKFNIGTAWNLDLLLDKDQVFNSSNKEYYFALSILGITVNTKYFSKNLHEPIILKDKIMLKLLTNISTLKDFLTNYSKVPIYFHYGSKIIATSAIDLKNFLVNTSDVSFSIEQTCDFQSAEDSSVPVRPKSRKPYITTETILELFVGDSQSTIPSVTNSTESITWKSKTVMEANTSQTNIDLMKSQTSISDCISSSQIRAQKYPQVSDLNSSSVSPESNNISNIIMVSNPTETTFCDTIDQSQLLDKFSKLILTSNSDESSNANIDFKKFYCSNDSSQIIFSPRSEFLDVTVPPNVVGGCRTPQTVMENYAARNSDSKSANSVNDPNVFMLLTPPNDLKLIRNVKWDLSPQNAESSFLSSSQEADSQQSHVKEVGNVLRIDPSLTLIPNSHICPSSSETQSSNSNQSINNSTNAETAPTCSNFLTGQNLLNVSNSTGTIMFKTVNSIVMETLNACGDQINARDITAMNNVKSNQSSEDVGVQTTPRGYKITKSVHTLLKNTPSAKKTMSRIAANYSSENDNYRLFCLSVAFSTITWRQILSIDGFQFKVSHPKASNILIIACDLNGFPNRKDNFLLDDVYFKLYFISTEENILHLISMYPPTVSIQTMTDHNLVEDFEVYTKLLLNQGSKECDYFAVPNSLWDENEIVCDIQVHMKVSPIDTNENIFSSDFDIEPIILDDWFALKTLTDLEKWKEKQEILFQDNLKRLECEKLELLQAEWNLKRIELETKLRSGMEKCKILAAELSSAANEFRLNRKVKNNTIEHQVTQMMEEEMKQTVRRLENEKYELLKTMEQLKYERNELDTKIRRKDDELTEMRKTTLTNEQTKLVFKELRALEEKFQEALVEKAFFKEEWHKALKEAHTLKSEDQRIIQEDIQKNKEELSQLNLDKFTNGSEASDEESSEDERANYKKMSQFIY